MKLYKITFQIQGRPQKWVRFGENTEDCLALTKQAIEREWPGENIYPISIFENCEFHDTDTNRDFIFIGENWIEKEVTYEI